MHVVLVAVRRVEVDHVRDVVDVEAACCDVGRDERRDACPTRTVRASARAGSATCCRASRRRRRVLARELLDELVGAVLGADEDECEPALARSSCSTSRSSLSSGVTGTNACSIVALLALVRQLGAEARRRCRCSRARARRPRRRASRRRASSAGSRDVREDAVDLRLEAHVEHPVGLVEDEHAHVVEVDQPPLDQVEEAARRRDQDVRAARTLGLAADGGAAVDRRDRGGSSPRRAGAGLTTWGRARGSGRGRVRAGRFPPAAVRSTTGIPKARVLPDPVGDAARMSTPARASSSTRLCTANGVMMLRSASVRTTGVLTPRALKDFDKLFDSLDQGSRCKKLESPDKEEREAESHGRKCAIRDAKVAGQNLMWNCVPLGMAQTKQVALVGRRA